MARDETLSFGAVSAGLAIPPALVYRKLPHHPVVELS